MREIGGTRNGGKKTPGAGEARPSGLLERNTCGFRGQC